MAHDGYMISRIKIQENGATISDRPGMTDVCKGFLLSKREVQDFFVDAMHVKDARSDGSYDILPCYASGTAMINNEVYKWTIRSGGIGEFENHNEKFLKVCGKGCCEKFTGIC